ncbi:MAG: chromate resistance protein ChrB domain-containing protein [Acidobacteriota bacterium]
MEGLIPRRWLLLIHQIPPKPNTLRVRIWRRLQQIGAVAIKQSVYALPQSDQAHEDLSWILKEIVQGGGDASISEARFLEGLSDEQVVSLFRSARKADYEEVTRECGHLRDLLSASPPTSRQQIGKIEAQLRRAQHRIEEIESIDFFETPDKATAEMSLRELQRQLSEPSMKDTVRTEPVSDLQAKIWVTRTNVFVDRIATGWLIRRFVDDQARFKFVAAKEYRAKKNELRFDMADAEFTHEGNRCTFEVMIERVGLNDRGLIPISKIVHDIDLKDGKYQRAETEGVQALLDGLVTEHAGDQERMDHGAEIFDNLYAHFRRQRHYGSGRQ